MKNAVLILGIACLLLYGVGSIYYFQGNEIYYERFTGIASLLLFLVWMPLFLIWRYLVKYDRREAEKEAEYEKENS